MDESRFDLRVIKKRPTSLEVRLISCNFLFSLFSRKNVFIFLDFSFVVKMINGNQLNHSIKLAFISCLVMSKNFLMFFLPFLHHTKKVFVQERNGAWATERRKTERSL